MTNYVHMIFIMLITQNCDFVLTWNCKMNPGVTVRSRWKTVSWAYLQHHCQTLSHTVCRALKLRTKSTELWTQRQMVKHRSPVKLHGCHLVGGLHRDWCSSDLWYFSWSHVESVPRRVMWIYFLGCVMWNTRVPLIAHWTPYCGLISQKTQQYTSHFESTVIISIKKTTGLSWTCGRLFLSWLEILFAEAYWIGCL